MDPCHNDKQGFDEWITAKQANRAKQARNTNQTERNNMKTNYEYVKGWITNYGIIIGFNNLDEAIMDDLEGISAKFDTWLAEVTKDFPIVSCGSENLARWLDEECA